MSASSTPEKHERAEHTRNDTQYRLDSAAEPPHALTPLQHHILPLPNLRLPQAKAPVKSRLGLD